MEPNDRSGMSESTMNINHPLRVSVHVEFFLDLGGHSLRAAKMVSKLRNDPRLAFRAIQWMTPYIVFSTVVCILISGIKGSSTSFLRSLTEGKKYAVYGIDFLFNLLQIT